ncbi:PR-1-like protein [Gymnopus androsaceus JB14]|uniref:PR-1-like protein n=1 Tax=Gymnopus androsaceus JB14 TaxID=1447944 RepID=A0A6A4I1U6_9AGAR|nr:PR-1-like protein [Gymnopus androsaceus JB14]
MQWTCTSWYRARFGAGPLVWSEDLYPETEEWANSCYWGHRQALFASWDRGNPEYGENIAARSPNGIDVGEGLAMWMAEASDYNYFDPTFSEDTGHFTQVVWNNTRAVACWISNQCNFLGRGTGYLVCRYDPPGNVEGEFAENVGQARY